MKLSVSAYRAHASAHKKILDTAYQLNYGSTAASSASASATSHHPYKVEPLSGDEPTAASLAPGSMGVTVAGGAQHLLAADNSGSDTPVNSPRSPLNTSRDEDDDSSNAPSSECKSPSQRYGASSPGQYDAASSTGDRSGTGTGTSVGSGSANDSGDIAAAAAAASGGGSGGGGAGGGSGVGSLQSVAEATAKAATQSWRNIRAVMAYYHTLRKIKRTKSNQRWMKLRTTVQLSSAIQKKPPLKREDSFLKRFSTRQIPETQETVEDTGSEGGGAAGGGAAAPRRRRRPQKHPRTVVNPDENFYFYWLLALTICVLYNLWALIVRQSFPEFQSMASSFWMVCDATSDVVFLCDVAVQLRTGYLEQGLMVYDSKKLAGHYLHSRAFLLDLGALCPLDLLQVRFGPQPMLRFPRFLKVYRAVNYYYMVESRTVWPNLWRVVNLIHILLILAHWFGCFYFLLSEAEGFQGDWVYPYRPGDYATLTRKYLGSLYWSTLTLTTIGDLPTPETNAEKTVTVDGLKSLPRRGLKSRLLQFNTDGGYVFTIVSYLIGVFIFATIVGQVGNVITNRNANRLEFERLLDGAKMYMRHHKVPSGMKKRVLRWYDYSWSRGRIQGGGDINTALGLLPDKLKTELALHVNLSVLKKVTIFQECQPEFLHDLVLKMKAYIFTPGDSICRKGEVAREMFIIADGILEVLSETGRVLTSMKAGDFFGEIGILNLDGLNKRTADVRSVGYSELFSLSREDVLAAMKDYPEAQEILQALGRKRLMEVRNSAKHPHPSSHRTSNKHHRSRNVDHGPRGDDTDGGNSRGLVGKIKNEAKGLRNALRKSRAYRKSDESLELQPLHTPSKGVLKRMPRVRSDEMSQEDAPDPGGGHAHDAAPSNITSPLGAGLPLLSRLRLLKEKQDNEERASICGPLASPSSAVTSPPPVPVAVAEEPPREVIGAGLPLLQRLLLLKAKEDRAAAAAAAAVTSTSTTTTTTTTTTQASSASSVIVMSTTAAPATTVASVLQRSRSRSPSPALSPKPAPVKVSFRDRLFAVRAAAVTTAAATSTPVPESPKKESAPVQVTVQMVVEEPPCASTPDVVRDTRDTRDSSSSASGDPHPHAGGVSLLETTPSTDSGDPWSKLKQAAIVRDNSFTTTAPAALPEENPGSCVSCVLSVVPMGPSDNNVVSVGVPRRTKPGLLQLQARTKHYESIDDLSPEYGGLPFVKKLKILNERQKLAELESAMKTRSVSLDIPDTQAPYDDSTLTRSHSEASAMHRRNSNVVRLSAQPQNPPPPTSPESNETPERRNLKSILKKLTEDGRQPTTSAPQHLIHRSRSRLANGSSSSSSSSSSSNNNNNNNNNSSNSVRAAEFRQLMRAPTVEGYAARHSKLVKSVTFNRDTLQSPPSDVPPPALPVPTPHSQPIDTTTIPLSSPSPPPLPLPLPVPPPPTSPPTSAPPLSPLAAGAPTTTITTTAAADKQPDDCTVPLEDTQPERTPTTGNQVKFAKGPLDEHEYFGEALVAIKQVINAHLQEMQQKFQIRFDRLEQEVRSRDTVIGQLRAHIHELEKSIDDSYTASDSLDTVISRADRRSWDEPSNQESMELQELPESMRPQRAWSPRRGHADSFVLDVDSATDDTDSDICDSSDLGDADGDPDTDTYLHNSNWEVEMLAAQIRQQRRSASFDQNAASTTRSTLTRRRLLCRGYSADAGGRD